MPNVDINVTALIIAVVVNMIIGFVWYAPQVFGNAWMKMNGISKKDMKSGRLVPILAMLVLAIVQAVVLKHFIVYAQHYNTGYSTTEAGFLTGLWAWVGFVAPVMGASYMFAGRRKKLLAIDTGYYLVALPLMGMILSHWV